MTPIRFRHVSPKSGARPARALLLSMLAAATLAFAACDRGPSTPQPAPAGTRPAAAAPTIPAELGQRFVDRLFAAHIVPGFDALDAQVVALGGAVDAFCASRDAERFAALQSAWIATALAWQPLRWLQTGPATEQHRALRIDAWPRARLPNIATRVEQLLASGQNVDAAAIADQPVQVQGLPALEALLFDARSATDFPADAAGDRRCALLAGIAGNLAAITSLQARLWRRGAGGGHAANAVFVSAPGATIPPQSVLDLVGNLAMQHLVEIKDDALGNPIGIGTDGIAITPRPPLAHSSRSRASLRRVQASLASLRAVYSGDRGDEAGYGLDDLLAALGQDDAAQEFESRLEAAIEQAAAVVDAGLSIDEVPRDQAAHDALVELHRRVRALEVDAQESLMPALGVTLTFNFADGD